VEEVLAGQLLGGVHGLFADGAVIITLRQLSVSCIRKGVSKVPGGCSIGQESAQLFLQGAQDGLEESAGRESTKCTQRPS
jgi:hypothetical protein